MPLVSGGSGGDITSTVINNLYYANNGTINKCTTTDPGRVGGAAPNYHTYMRLPMDTLDAATLIKSFQVRAHTAAPPGGQPAQVAPPNVVIWASDLTGLELLNFTGGPPAVTANGFLGYNLAAANTTYAAVSPGTLRAQLKTIISSANFAAGFTSAYVYIPARYVQQGAGKFTDVEFRPDVATAGAAATTYIDSVTCIWSTIAAADEQTTTNTFDEFATADGSYFAYALETTRGIPEKPIYMLDFNSSDLDSDADSIESQALRKERMSPAKMAVGREGASGGVAYETTPERCWGLLMGFLKITNSSNNGGTWTHTFGVAQSKEVYTFTVAKKYGNSFLSLFRGCVIDSLALRCAINSLVDATMQLKARQEWTYDIPSCGNADEYIIDSAAAYDANSPLAYTGGQITIGSVVNYGTIPQATISFLNAAQEIHGIRRRRDITGHYVGGFGVMVDFDIHFKDHYMLRKFLGQASAKYPIQAGTSLQFDEVDLAFAGPAGAATQEMVVQVKKMIYKTIRKPVAGKGSTIVLSVRGVGTIDVGSGTSLVVTVKSTNPASYFAPSGNLVNVQPEGAVLP